MATNFLHGVEVLEVTSGPRPIRTVRSSVIGIVGTAPEADADVFPLNQPVVIAGSRSEAAKLYTDSSGAADEGTLPAAVDGILDQIGALIIVIRVEADADETVEITNVIGGAHADTGALQGVHALSGAESITGFSPRILIAPGFTHQRPSAGSNPVLVAMQTIATSMRAIVVADGPNTGHDDAILAATDFGEDRFYVVDPWHKIFRRGVTIDVPASSRVAGVIARTDNDVGFWASPSNKTINGITGLGRPISFKLGDPNSRANLLNEKKIATTIRQNGYRLWGNLSLAMDPKWQFLSVRRTADILNDSLLEAHLWAVDRGITRTYVEDVVDGVNGFIRGMVARGAILGGKCIPDPDLNSPENITLGQVYFSFDFTPVYPAQRVSFRSALVNNYLREIFA